MAIKDILLLGDQRLYEVSQDLTETELKELPSLVKDLEDTRLAFRKKHGRGRAIAAPQIGVPKRVLYFQVDQPLVMINPEITFQSQEMMEIWDDCMSFPDLLVKVKRHRACRVKYRDLQWSEKDLLVEGDMAELFQHEYDHLDGILAVSKAIDHRSFSLVSQKIDFNPDQRMGKCS